MKPGLAFSTFVLSGTCFFANTSATAAEFDNDLDKTFQVSPGGTLVVDADQGGCDVTTSGTDRAQIRVLRKARNATQSQADGLFANHQVTFDQDGGKISVTAKRKTNVSLFRGSNPPWLEVRYVIEIPRKFDVDLKTAGGDVRIGDLDGKVKARTSSGAIRLQSATGDVTAENAGGNISAAEVGGAVTARTSSGSISVRKIGGAATLSNAGGDIEVAEAGKSVAAKTTSGSIRLRSVQEDLEANDAGGNIAVESVGGDVKVATTSGSIGLGHVKGKTVSAHNAGGNIAIDTAEGDIEAKTTSGSIRIKVAKGSVNARNAGGEIAIGDANDAVKVETTSGPIKIRTAKGQIDARDSGGDIMVGDAAKEVTVHTTSGSITINSAKATVSAIDAGGNIEVKKAAAAVQAETTSGAIDVGFVAQPTEDSSLKVSGGSVTVTLPKGAGFGVDARASGGRIATDVPITSESSQRRGDVLKGKVNEGGPALVLRSSSGDIRIKLSTTETAKVQAEEETK
jgi:DUF4097 and DUF4098 domain-containing protein YvlB